MEPEVKGVLIIVVGIVSIVIGCMIIDSINQGRFVNNGYTRKTIIGSSLVQWVKE